MYILHKMTLCDSFRRFINCIYLGFNNGYPFCVDNEPPAFRNCPAHPITVEKGPNGFLLPVNFTQPVAVDNSGSIARTDVKPEGFNLPLTTFEDLMIEYFAYDYDGNVAICQVKYLLFIMFFF